MSKKMAGIVTVYGVLLFALGYITSRIHPEAGRPLFLIGAIGGGLCSCWGVWALAGYRSRMWITLSTGVIAFMLLAQTISSWFSPHPASIRTLLAFGLVLTVSLLMYVLHGERGADFYSTGPQNGAGVKAGK